MEIEIPSGGCFIATGDNTFAHYLNNRRITYYFHDGKLIQGSSTTYTNLPNGYHCLSKGDVLYKPEIYVYFSAISFGLVAIIGILIFNLIIKRLWGSR